MTLGLSWFTSVWMAERALLSRAEVSAMWASLHRMVSMDAHAAVFSSVLWGGLYLEEANGVYYRYAVNAAGQYVRVRQGGGTAVLAEHLHSVTIALNRGMIFLQATFDDGESKEMNLCTIQACFG